MSELSNKDIQMSKGYAILTMLMLHLFCLQGGRVIGNHLIWMDPETPVLYYVGWICAICAPTYCICSGYAHYKQGEIKGLTRKKRLKRVFKFLVGFWIVCLFVVSIGLILGSKEIPGSILEFVMNLCLVSWSYTGIWWFAFVYVVYVTLSKTIYGVIEEKNNTFVIVFLLVQFIFFEVLQKIIPAYIAGHGILEWVWDRIYYLSGARLLCYMGGMYLAKYRCISKTKDILLKLQYPNMMIFLTLSCMIAGLLILDKGILIVFFAFPVFIGFNCLRKGELTTKIMSLLGKYSTFVWLLHPFIYSGRFKELTDLWLCLRYPIFLLLGLLLTTIITAIPLEKLSGNILQRFEQV